MTTKEYLQQAYRLNQLIESDRMELESLREMSTNITNNFLKDRIQSSAEKDKVGAIVAKIVDLERQVRFELNKFLDLKKDIREAVNNVRDIEEMLLLRLRYVEFLKWDEISKRMGCSVRQIHRIHSDALKNIDLRIA